MLIHDMIRRCFTTAQIADAAECSERSIRNIRTNAYLVAKAHHLTVGADHEV